MSSPSVDFTLNAGVRRLGTQKPSAARCFFVMQMLQQRMLMIRPCTHSNEPPLSLFGEGSEGGFSDGKITSDCTSFKLTHLPPFF